MRIYLGRFPKPEFSEDGRRIRVYLGMRYKGIFLRPQDIAIKEGDLALFHLQEKSKTQGRIVAIDKVYLDKDGFSTVRVLGNKKAAPLFEGEAEIVTQFKRLEVPRMKIKIVVVEKEGEKLFQYGNLLFDTLSAEEFFEKGSLTIMRNGEVFDQTSSIEYWGTHAACHCFLGLRKLFKGLTWADAVGGLNPDMLQVGDILTNHLH